MLQKIFCILPMLVLVFSCKDEAKRHEDVNSNVSIQWNDNETGKISSIVEDVKYIPIETHPDGLFDGGVPVKIILRNDRILILDTRKAQALQMFDMNGRFLSRIGHRGGGPGEYALLWSFTADEKAIYLFDISKSKILVYDWQGNYIRDMKVPARIQDLAILENGDFILAADVDYAEKGMDYRILVTDRNLKIKNKFFKSNESDSKLKMTYSFGESTDNITYQNFVQDTLVVFDKKTGVHTTYSFDFPKKVPMEERSGWNFGKKGDYQYLSFGPALLLGKYISGCVSSKPFLMDTKTEKIYFNDEKSLYGIRGGVYDDYFIFVFTGSYYRNVVEKGNWPRAPKEMDEFFMADDENVGLLLYKLKQ